MLQLQLKAKRELTLESLWEFMITWQLQSEAGIIMSSWWPLNLLWCGPILEAALLGQIQSQMSLSIITRLISSLRLNVKANKQYLNLTDCKFKTSKQKDSYFLLLKVLLLTLCVNSLKSYIWNLNMDKLWTNFLLSLIETSRDNWKSAINMIHYFITVVMWGTNMSLEQDLSKTRITILNTNQME